MKNKSLVPENLAKKRDKIIIQTSVIGIITNIFLSIFKAMIGFASNSIAVILDAVNNLSDAMSSIITIVGTKLAGKLPDKKHPLGYGRIEYLSAAIVSGIVMYAGITSLVESVKKIIRPEKPDYNAISLLIIAIAIVVKIILGRYVKTQGEKVKSGSLIASGSDAMFDAILSGSVLISAIIFMWSGISLEPYVGIIIAVFIIKAGIDMMIDSLNQILGVRVDKEKENKIKELLSEDPEVRGAYDLIIYNYGPGKDLASVHLELPDTMTARQIDKLTRKLERKIYEQTGVVLAGVGLYSYNTGSDESADIQKKVRELVIKHDWAVQLHGFYVDTETKEMRFDVVMSFDINPEEGVKIIYNEVKEAYPKYAIQIAPDVDVSD